MVRGWRRGAPTDRTNLSICLVCFCLHGSLAQVLDRFGGGGLGAPSGAGAGPDPDPEDVVMDIPIAQRLDEDEKELESEPEQEQHGPSDGDRDRLIENWEGGLRAAFSILNERAVAIRQSDGWKRALHHSQDKAGMLR